MTGRTLVAGIGNIFLGDDGFGVEVARQLAGADLPAGVTVTDYGIRGMHLAYDLASGFDTAILVDATARGGAPGTIYVIEPDLPSGPAEPAVGPDSHPLLDAHGMQPDVVLGMLDLLGGARPAQLLIVGCEPATVEERMGLSEPVTACVPEAVRVVLELVTDGPQAWAQQRRGAGHGTHIHGAAQPGDTDLDAGGYRRGAFIDGAQHHAAARRGRLFTKGWRHVPRHSR
ncbi:MAG TPA: hydrogenase maturation protease [Streptosporangiaceae bacterium]|jgi:hydrogenase maturation protease